MIGEQMTQLDSTSKTLVKLDLFFLGTIVIGLLIYYNIGINDNLTVIVLGACATVGLFIAVYIIKNRLEDRI